MREKIQQTRSNHVRRDPAFHFFLIPALLLLLLWSVIHLVRHLETSSVAFLVITVLMLVTALKSRLYALKMQDRIIRLEERLRLSRLLPEAFRLRLDELNESQLIALRFASDAEVPGLVQRTLNENLGAKQIKEAIRDWRPDYLRV
ncbi:MAG: DUF6526 family protein [Bryobacteraceae bacterium]